jgi:hypothetical protein
MADFVGHTSEQQAFQISEAPAAHDDEIGVVTIRGVKDLLAGAATCHKSLNFQCTLLLSNLLRLADYAIANGTEHLSQVEPFELDELLEMSRDVFIYDIGQHMEKYELCVVDPSQGSSHGHGASSVIRTVRRHENCPHHRQLTATLEADEHHCDMTGPLQV